MKSVLIVDQENALRRVGHAYNIQDAKICSALCVTRVVITPKNHPSWMPKRPRLWLGRAQRDGTGCIQTEVPITVCPVYAFQRNIPAAAFYRQTGGALV